MNYGKLYSLDKGYRCLMLDILYPTWDARKRAIIVQYQRMRREVADCNDNAIIKILSLTFSVSRWYVWAVIRKVSKPHHKKR